MTHISILTDLEVIQFKVMNLELEIIIRTYLRKKQSNSMKGSKIIYKIFIFFCIYALIVDYSRCEATRCRFFFMEIDKAKERTDHLMVRDQRHPRPRVTPEELQVRRPPFRRR